MKIKLISFMMALVMLLSVLLISCDDEVVTPETTEAAAVEEETTEAVVETSILLFDANEIYYSIVRGTYATDVEVNAVVALNVAFREAYPGTWRASIGDDFFKGQVKGEAYEIEGKEILVGLTNRKESHEVHATLEKDKYAIKVVGEKLVIVGYDEYATASAVEEFINTYLSEKIADKLELDKRSEERR